MATFRFSSLDMSAFSQCRECFVPMAGILSIKAREICHGCGGHALNIHNESPSSLEDMLIKFKRKDPKCRQLRL